VSLSEWRGNVNSIVEDLTRLSPKRLERRLEELAGEAMPCVSVVPLEANPGDGLTVGLWVESEGRRDVLDLARVLESEPGGHVVTGWSLLSPSRRHRQWRLLLRVHFERPVLCSFVVRFDVHDHQSDEMRSALPLLLAAAGFALAFDRLPEAERPLTWVPAPTARECLYDVLASAAA
jgi:hypothetical protein